MPGAASREESHAGAGDTWRNWCDAVCLRLGGIREEGAGLLRPFVRGRAWGEAFAGGGPRLTNSPRCCQRISGTGCQWLQAVDILVSCYSVTSHRKGYNFKRNRRFIHGYRHFQKRSEINDLTGVIQRCRSTLSRISTFFSEIGFSGQRSGDENGFAYDLVVDDSG